MSVPVMEEDSTVELISPDQDLCIALVYIYIYIYIYIYCNAQPLDMCELASQPMLPNQV